MLNQIEKIIHKRLTSIFIRSIAALAGLIILLVIVGDNFKLLELGLTIVKIWWLTMFSIGMIAISITFSTNWQRVGLFATILLTGISSQLALTAPKWFQPINLINSDKFTIICNIFLIIQFITVVTTFSSYKTRIQIKHFLQSVGTWKIIIFVLLLIGFSSSVMPHINAHNFQSLIKQLIYSSLFLSLNIMTILALVFSLSEQKLPSFVISIPKLLSFPTSTIQLRPYDYYVPYVAALWIFIISALLCFFAFERLPHVEDELIYLFQAKYLFSGNLYVPAPPVPEAFEFYLLQVTDNRWFAVTFPGWSLVLAIGIATYTSWLVNPVLAAISILLAHAFVRRTTNHGTANIVVLLMVVSPWFIAMSASLMNHTVTLTLTLASWLTLHVAKSNRSVLLSFSAGLFAGFLFFIRPIDGLVIGVLTGIWGLFYLNIRAGGYPLIIGFSLGCIAIGGLIFPYNLIMTGDPLLTTLNEYINQLWYPGTNSMGFGPDIGPSNLWGSLDLYTGHSVFEALVNFQHNAFMLNYELFGWGSGSLFLVFIHMLWGKWNQFERYMITVVIVTIAMYSLYWFSAGFYIGPRYWFLTFFPLVVLTTGGLRTLVEVCVSKTATIKTNSSIATSKIGIVFLALSLVSMISFLPWRGATRYYEYRGYHTDYRELIGTMDLSNSLIFLRDTNESDFASAFLFTEPDFSGDSPIFAYDLGPESNFEVATAFPEHRIYFAVGRSKTNEKANIIEGPLSLDAMSQKLSK